MEKGHEEETQQEVQKQHCDDECQECHEETWNKKGKGIHPI